MMDIRCDYVVVGTGSAGAVIASRLSADPAAEVVALEAGPRDTNRLIRIPAAFSKLYRSEVDWDYLTEPQKELNGRQNLLAPRQSPRRLIVNERHVLGAGIRGRL